MDKPKSTRKYLYDASSETQITLTLAEMETEQLSSHALSNSILDKLILIPLGIWLDVI